MQRDFLMLLKGTVLEWVGQALDAQLDRVRTENVPSPQSVSPWKSRTLPEGRGVEANSRLASPLSLVSRVRPTLLDLLNLADARL